MNEVQHQSNTDMENSIISSQNEGNLDLYNRVRSVPENALKKIEAGRLKGKSDINPMWRIQCLTREFGPAGFGFTINVSKEWTEVCENGEQPQPNIPQMQQPANPGLSPSMSSWRQAVAFCAKQNDTEENLRTRINKKYNISDENINLLLRQAGKLS